MILPDGRTLLSWAAEHGVTDVVEYLLSRDDIEVDLKDSDGATPLWWASRRANTDIVKMLSATGKVDVNAVRV
ncbi:hypothetical protein BJY04DRAFT_200378 [Aspergillus karnatakaensis]|uniref:uncharacterized protein n=1 Tax=Aspergillus karnatakaensis TaxID=1810916 RepID=UPI003CCD04CA